MVAPTAAGAWLLEDAAQALGARLAGQPVGTLGDFGLFSLGIGKPLSTGGGGVVCARQPQHAALVGDAWRALPLPTAAQSAIAWLRQVAFQTVLQPRPWWLATRLGALRVGTNEASWGYRVRPLTGPQAATGRRLLARLDAIQAQRCRNAAALAADLPVRWRVVGVDSAESACLRLPLILDDEAQRDRLLHALWDAGIGAGRLYEQTLAARFPGAGSAPYPGAERVARCLLTLPTHHLLTDRDRAVTRRLLHAVA